MPLRYIEMELMRARDAQAARITIYRKALERIANLNCAKCEDYVREADAIAVDALVAVDNIDEARIENDVVSTPRRDAA
jgi:hypothetical protein